MAKKISLRSYQENLLSRLREQAGKQLPEMRLGVQAGGRNWLVDLREAAEVMPVPELSAVPWAQPWFLGVANVRGNVCAVSDFSAYSGDGPTVPASANRLLLINARLLDNTALLVARVLGLRKLAELTSQGRPSGVPPWVAADYLDAEGLSWRELSLAALAQENAFLRLSAT